jgi:hypothetical protein
MKTIPCSEQHTRGALILRILRAGPNSDDAEPFTEEMNHEKYGCRCGSRQSDVKEAISGYF